MKLNLKKPLVFFDIESTGLNISKDRIIEISILKVNPNGSEETKTYRINPEIPLTEEASKITGIKDEDLVGYPTFNKVAKEIARFIEGCDLAGYNSNRFDIPILAEEFLRAGVDFDLKRHNHIDVQTIFHKMEKRTLSAAYKFYCKKELNNAHTAEADTYATYEVLKAQLDMYQDVEYEDKDGNKAIPVVNDMQKLSEFSSHNKNVDIVGHIIYNNKNQEVFNFGKNKGKLVEEVFTKQPQYYSWIINSEFPEYTKKVCTQIKLRMSSKFLK